MSEEKKYEKTEIVIKGNLPFPTQNDPFSKKETKEWGMAVAKAIQGTHFYRYDGGVCGFYTDREVFLERRLYSKGLQNTKKYTDHIATNGDLSFLNLDFRSRSIIPKLVDMVVNGIADREYSIRAFSTDPISQDNRIKYRKGIQTDMLAKPLLEKAGEMGIDVASMPLDQLPENDDELNLHMQMEYKPSIELSEELAIQTVFLENEFNDLVKKRCEMDLAVCGKAFAKHRYVEGKGILLEYVDVVNKFEMYSDDPYFRDVMYHGELKQVLISDLLIEYPFLNDAENEGLRAQLEYSGNNWWNYHAISQNDRLKGTTNVMYFTYRTTKPKTSKIKGTELGGKVVEEFVENANVKKDYSGNFTKSTTVDEVEFEGVYVLGTDILLKWELCPNMIRSKSNKQRIVSQYVGCAPRKQNGFIESIVSRMIPFEDDIQIAELKGQQIIQKINPDGFAIDLDGLADMDLGDGKALTPIEHLNMLLQTGSVFTRSLTASGDFNYAKNVITELRTGGSLDKLQALANVRMDRLTMMKEVVGLNSASDASDPSPDALVGIQKIAALNSNIATRHILDASVHIATRIAEATSLRISDVLKYSPYREDLIRKIGATAVLDLDELRDLHLSDFGIFLELYMDYEERAKLENDLTKEIEKGFLSTEAKYKILDMRNMKQAYNYLAVFRKRFDKEKQKQKEQDYEAQSQANIRAAQSAEQARQQTEQMILQGKMQLQELINKGLNDKEMVQGDESRKTLGMKIQGDVQVAQIQGGVAMQKQTEAEDRKDERASQQASEQSQLLVERNKEKPQAIDFKAQNANAQLFQP